MDPDFSPSDPRPTGQALLLAFWASLSPIPAPEGRIEPRPDTEVKRNRASSKPELISVLIARFSNCSAGFTARNVGGHRH
jgi:hypothetical protein